MPYVIVKLQSGRSEQQQAALAEAVTRAVVETLKTGEESASVGVEDVRPDDWTEQVYKPDIIAKAGTIYSVSPVVLPSLPNTARRRGAWP